jgi:hypothetical protein
MKEVIREPKVGVRRWRIRGKQDDWFVAELIQECRNMMHRMPVYFMSNEGIIAGEVVTKIDRDMFQRY